MIQLFLLVFNFYFITVNCLSQYPIVLVISYDAFRYNYFDKGVTPTLASIRKNSCYADYLDNVFITKTFTNHHSIATGLYPEVHGVMGNSFYDPILKKKLDYSYEMWHSSDNVTPIWIENEKHGKGRFSGVMMWPGNEYNYSGISPTYSQPWTTKINWHKRVDTVISWIKDPKKPANLVMLYFEEPDTHSHAFGPDSNANSDELRLMDDITNYLMNKLEAEGIKQYINIFFVSDHGMETVTKSGIIDLKSYVKDEDYDFYEKSPTLHIYPKPGKSLNVYKNLLQGASETKKFKVFKKDDLPTKWHYSQNIRFPPIFVVADPPYVFNDFYETIAYFEKQYNFIATNESKFGVHGYDNSLSNMKPYFMAIGPNIQMKKKVKPFQTIDLFAIWSQLLGFPEAILKTNGSSLPAKEILIINRSPVLNASITAGVFGGILVLFAIIVAAWLVHRKLRNKYYKFLKMDVNDDSESAQRLLDDEN